MGSLVARVVCMSLAVASLLAEAGCTKAGVDADKKDAGAASPIDGASEGGSDARLDLDAGQDAGPPFAGRILMGVVSPGLLLLQPSSFEGYLSAWADAGVQGIHVFAAWRDRCFRCGPSLPPVLDVDTEPTEGTFDFSGYFPSLDEAASRNFQMIVSFMLYGSLDSLAPDAGGGNWISLPPFVTVDDTMVCRGSDGGDAPYARTGILPGALSFPRFTNAATLQRLLTFVDAVVAQFGARYGDRILAYSFPLDGTGENEYPLGEYCDTSPDSLAGFQDFLATRYASPAALSQAWGVAPPFTSFAEASILNGAPPPPAGQAPQSFLDFSAYREAALGSVLQAIRDHVHAGGGRALSQYGSVFDAQSFKRGTYGFGRQVPGFDLVVGDDGPTFDHRYSVDLLRTNAPGIPVGTEVAPPCLFSCTLTPASGCCPASVFPGGNDVDAGIAGMLAQVSQTYGSGGAYVGFDNWDNFYPNVFSSFGPVLGSSDQLAVQALTSASPVATQTLSLKQLYVHREDAMYLGSLEAAHAQLSGDGGLPVAVVVVDDL